MKYPATPARRTTVGMRNSEIRCRRFNLEAVPQAENEVRPAEGRQVAVPVIPVEFQLDVEVASQSLPQADRLAPEPPSELAGGLVEKVVPHDEAKPSDEPRDVQRSLNVVARVPVLVDIQNQGFTPETEQAAAPLEIDTPRTDASQLSSRRPRRRVAAAQALQQADPGREAPASEAEAPDGIGAALALNPELLCPRLVEDREVGLEVA